jgi:hypothetical protein
MDDFRTKTEEEIIEEGDFIGFINPEVGDCAKPI